jgi:hypothetical protein
MVLCHLVRCSTTWATLPVLCVICLLNRVLHLCPLESVSSYSGFLYSCITGTHHWVKFLLVDVGVPWPYSVQFELNSNWSPPNLYLQISWDYRCETPCQHTLMNRFQCRQKNLTLKKDDIYNFYSFKITKEGCLLRGWYNWWL